MCTPGLWIAAVDRAAIVVITCESIARTLAIQTSIVAGAEVFIVAVGCAGDRHVHASWSGGVAAVVRAQVVVIAHHGFTRTDAGRITLVVAGAGIAVVTGGA